MSYIIVAKPPVVENPLTEDEPMRFTSGETLEEAIAEGAPVVTRPATIEAVPHLGSVGLEVLREHIEGYIEVAYRLMLDKAGLESIDFICDEEGLIKELMPVLVRPTDGWVLRGPLVVARCTAEGEHVPLADNYFHDIWGMFSVLGFVDVKRVANGDHRPA